MKVLSTPHCHTTYVDGRSTAEEMVRSAVENGFVSLGFSEHGPQSFDPHASLAIEKIKAYKANVRSLREEYASRLPIYLGIEKDRLSTATRDGLDYMLGANHYLMDEGGFCAADGDLEPLIEWRESRFGGDGEALAAQFFRESGEFALREKPEFFAHFDLIKKRNGAGALYDADSPKVRDAAFEALDMILASGAILEVNTGGMARSNQPRPYPDPIYLRRWHELGGRVIVGSDCHFAPQIAYFFDGVIDYMKEAGFRTAWRLSASGDALVEEYPLD